METKEQFDEELQKIDELFEQRTVWDRIRTLFTGLKQPRSSREYKEAMIELQRLMSPVCAVLIPTIFIAILFVCAAPSKKDKSLMNISVAQAEEEQELEETEEVETPPDQLQDMTMDTIMEAPSTSIDVANPAETVLPTTQQATQIQSVDAVMDVRAPVMMKTVMGATRSAGARAKSLASYGGDAETEKCVMRALRWLKTQQNANGSWPGSGGASGMSTTGFVVLAFLAHGEKPGGSPEFGDCLQRAMEYLMKRKSWDAMETCALAEAYGMTRNPNIRDVVEASINQMADKLAETEWGSPIDGRPEVVRPVLLTMTFQVMSLRSAQLSKFKVPKMDRALAKLREGFLKQGNKKLGGFSSDTIGPPGVNYRRTGTWHFMMGVVGMQYLGSGDHPIIEKTLRLLDDDWEPPTLGYSDIACCPVRGNYWATMVFFNEGGPRWKKWNAMMKYVYTKGQHVRKGQYKDHKEKEHEVGYWTCQDMHNGDNNYSVYPAVRNTPIMTTCYIAQQLMVYYRYLPTGSKEAWNVKTDDTPVSTKAADDVSVGLDDL